ncbi:MAG: ABC transporter permease [candidate division WOR-3 bacterium]|nr:ABC transporter permease [candidate division WOR-3 bacterium]
MKRSINFESFLARRYIRIKKGEGFRSIITFFAGGGIALGVATLLVVLSVMNGMQMDLKNKIVGATSPLTVIKFHNEPIHNWESILDTVKTSIPEIQEGSPYIYSKALIKHHQWTDGIVIKGVDESTDSLVSDIPKNVILGDFDLSGKRIVLGRYVADLLRAHIGDTIAISSPFQVTPTPFGFLPSLENLIVSGIFDMGMFEYNATLGLISLENARNLFGIDGVTGIDFTIEDVYRAPDLSIDVAALLGYPYRVTNWEERNRTLLRALQIEKKTMFVILILIIIVAAFNIISSLILIVLSKMKEIGILKAIGTTSSSIMKVFLIDGFLVGGVGTGVGVGIAWILCRLLGKYQFINLPSDVYFLDKLPVQMEWQDFLVVALSAIVLSTLAALYPAKKASNLDPVEAIRNE